MERPVELGVYCENGVEVRNNRISQFTSVWTLGTSGHVVVVVVVVVVTDRYHAGPA